MVYLCAKAPVAAKGIIMKKMMISMKQTQVATDSPRLMKALLRDPSPISDRAYTHGNTYITNIALVTWQ